ncbi:GntR family transcriptional regulator YhfZ [Tetragenococcus halophilus]|uniref:GntR family transcriptional regulator YhfZ n=1 Tax=Tetragenococcus halophilus TaxID=51669 RepID=UPI002A982E16|nr:GntR family transcriptional regulator YhfZ [Tetragenococcus halophilus]
MSDNFKKKKGIVVNYLASDLLQLKKGDRLLSVSEYQNKYDTSRGTVQNAFTYLKKENAIQTKSHGHLGTFIEDIDYFILQKFAISESILGTMTLPYSKLYEGLATGIYEAFKDNQIALNMAYIRGSKERIYSISQKTYRFAVVSRFAAKQAIEQNKPIEIVVDFGNHTYLSEHVLLFSEPKRKRIVDNMRIAIDYDSFDQYILTQKMIEGKNVRLVSMPGHQIIFALKNGTIDAGIWNFDEINDRAYPDIYYSKISEENINLDMSASVIICQEEDSSMKAIFKKNIDKNKILEVQNKVKNGEIIPSY